MSIRLQILVSEGLDRRLHKAAQRSRLSTSAWVRQAIERALADDQPAGDALDRLARLAAPTGDIEQMLSEIEAGRG
jgi:predicted transcriptional regulator